ncbi:MAG: twin-arginine translocase TatA/TatE family subunit [Anaerolineales bacterium]|uniref:Sec-independent protein translocase protein TatA n=1 Tax=Candidatus Desulfolinea nitratireducens TaxID=2841698 RepID=A0A8J6NKR3_9CHLR|nr:twin-arginine translocase TatA/TatE family subunit [Candidatus Desulfolinea nitratireducens]MBL6961499.1 twin-arginine translocase TatA/TatE family subunit [Anaerolineales bacterium]
MFTKLGVPELLIILVIVVLLFGPGRLGKIAGELGSGIRNFREGIGEGKDNEESQEEEAKEEE